MPSAPNVAAQMPIPQDGSAQVAATPDQQSVPQSSGIPIYDISGKEPVLGNIDPSEVTEAVASGRYSLPQGALVPVLSPDGTPGTLDPTEAPQAFQSGYKYATQDDLDQAKYGSAGQQAIAGVEGVAQGLAGPLATGAEEALGVDPKDILKRAKYNPGTHYTSEILGLAGPALLSAGTSAAARLGLESAAEILPAINAASKFTQASVIEKAGQATSTALGLGGEGAGAVSQVLGGAAKAATEMALLQSGDETTKMLINDPEQSAQTAAASVGLAALMGGVAGGALGAVSPLWKATFGDKLGQVVEDFKGKINEHLTNPDPVSAMTEELQNHYNAITDMADEVYGAKGLKAQDIEKAVPELNDAMKTQVQDLDTKLQNTVDEMAKKPNSYPERLVSKLQDDLVAFRMSAGADKAAPELFNAIQDVKQTLQGYAKFDKFVKPVDEAYDFVQKAKGLAHDFRTSLEDPEVWGKAADRQQAINKAFKEYLPTLQDFEKKFTQEVNGVRQVDPGKVNTYLNQVDKPNAVIKKQMLENFLDKSEQYKNVISKTHANLGIDNPIPPTSLNVTRRSLEQKTTGGKLADIFINRGLSQAAGHGLGASVGAQAGHMTGIGGGFGALIGEHALGPFFSSVLPSLVKPVLSSIGSAEGFKAAVDYGTAVAKGEALATKAAKNLFKASGQILTESQMPKETDRNKINKVLQVARQNPQELMDNVSGNIGHYAPQHAQAIGALSGRAVNYLNSLRPNTDKAGPLDSARQATPMEQAAYNRALNIAQQPLSVLQKIKDGTITPQDIKHLANIYPNLYAGLQQKITNEMMNAVSKGHTVPYQTRLGLSLFLAQPLDSTITPQAIMAAQPPPPQPPPMVPNKTKKGTSTLGKLPNQYKTNTQSAEEDRGKRD